MSSDHCDDEPVPDLPIPSFVGSADWVDEHLGHLVCDRGATARPARRGGQSSADSALAALDIAGYAKRRSLVHPESSRGATSLSPYIRYGLITLADAIAAVRDAPTADRRKFVDELWWQEYTRHLYARVGTSNREALRRQPAVGSTRWAQPIDDEMVCLREVSEELEHTGWLVNQTRMWMASHWSVRAGHDWREGEDWMFRHLLDGSRAANRYGWQWSVGAMTSEPYGFSRWQVERRASAWCQSCPLSEVCPIQDWPTAASGDPKDDGRLRSGDDFVGPNEPVVTGVPKAVWLTAESLGARDPALTAWPDAPVVFVFDEPWLDRLQLSAKRLVFIVETLAELAEHREVRVMLDDPVRALNGIPIASTFAPVPGYQTRVAQLNVVATYPYPWLSRPGGGDVRSHSAWTRTTSGRRSP